MADDLASKSHSRTWKLCPQPPLVSSISNNVHWSLDMPEQITGGRAVKDSQ